jgi:autotransporter-associated beta strand protein
MEFRGGRTGGGKLGGIWRVRREERRVRRAGLRLGLERLEERVVLSTWSGADAVAISNDNWSDNNNWDTAPTTGSDLVFPTGLSGAALTSNNDTSITPFGSLTIADTGYTITGDGVTLTGAIDASQSTGSSVLNLPVNFGTTAGTVTVDQAPATLSMGGAITGSAGLTKQGSGVLDLSGTNTYTGGTTVAAGTLLVDGTAPGAVAVSSGATLGGKGTVGSIATTAAATVSPGDSPTATGVLTDSGPLTLDSSSSFDVAITGATVGTNYDQLAAGGAINLAGATLNVATGSFDPTPGEQFTIVDNTSGSAITGTFAGLAEGATLTADGHDFAISYKGGSSGQDVVLTALPATTFTWSGAVASGSTPNDNWSDGNNWVGGVAPTTGAGDSLYFPTGLTGAALTSNDDISGGSFGSLIIADTGYTIASTQGYGVTLSGTIDATQASGSSTLSLPVNFGTNAGTVAVDNTAAALSMGGVVTGSAGLTKQGSGVLDLSGTNTYTGGTTVDAGALLVDGTAPGAVAVSSGATLGGVGTVGSIATTAATVSPGDSSTLTGVLTDSGPLTLDSNSNFDVTINGTTSGTNYDQLAAGGAINLAGATLNVATGSFDPTPGEQFTIVDNTSGSAITGTFAGLAEGATLTADGHDFAISYKGGSNGQDVVLTAVNPPTATWSGTDAIGTTPNDNWSDPANWLGNKAPVAGDSLIFPTGPTGAALTSNNDIANTLFNSITVQASGYTIQGDGVGIAGSIDSSQSTGSSTLSLPITFNPGVGTTTVDNSGATLLLTGVVTASSGLTKQGQGTLSLEANDGSLPAVVDAGTLLVDGTAGDITVNTGTTLGGVGTVAEISTTSGTVNPGDSAAATGILTDTGGLVLSGSSTFAAELNGTTAGSGYDQLVAGSGGTGGTVNVTGATLNVTLGSAFPSGSGQQYTILHNTSGSAIVGTFSGLAQGATLTVGSQSFSISYTGGTDGQDVVLTSLVSTTTTLSPVTGTPVSGQPVTLTATVTAASGTGTPTGSVEFENGSTDLGTVTLSSGKATLNTTQLTAGTNTITAIYSGNATYASSTSSTIAVVVAQASTTTKVTSNLNPSVTGQPVTLTATVSPVSPGSGTPTGTVIFSNGSTQLGTENLADGVATYTTTALPTGTNSITAVYSGDTNFTGSTSPAFNQVVTAGIASVTVSASNTNPFALQPITLTAIVSVATGLGTPTGSVTFFNSAGTNLGTATLSSGTASITASGLPTGAQSITAVYSGDSNFQGATSPPLRVVVGSPTDLFVNQVYLDVLGVPASYSATLWSALINGGYSPKYVARRILESPQAKVAAVESVYKSLLGRAATPEELKRALASGSTSTTPLYIDVFGSKEFYLTQGKGTTDGFLTALAQDWFGTPFSASTQARLARQISHGVSRTQIARQVLTSPSGVNAQVNSIFEAILDRPATAKEEKQFAPLVRQGNLVSVYDTLFASEEFKAKFVDLV